MTDIMNKILEVLKSFAGEKTSPTSIGLDIGTNSVKMVEVQKTDNHYELLNWSIIPLEGGDTSGAVRKAVAKVSDPNVSPASAVFGKGTLIRFIDMPKMSLADLKKSFQYEVDKYFPFPKDQIYTDCVILESERRDNKMQVMAAAVKKEMVDQRMALMNEIGLPADFITLNSIAIANVMNMLGRQEENGQNKNAVAILDVGETVSNIMITIGRTPLFIRDIFIGTRDFTRGISSHLGVGIQDAEKLKRDPVERAQEVQHAVSYSAANLTSELRLSFDYFMTENSVSITKLFMAGGGAMLSGLSEAISKNLDVQIEQWNPIGLVALSENVKPEEIIKESSRLGVALGLALY